jgi:hypothetical protein
MTQPGIKPANRSIRIEWGEHPIASAKFHSHSLRMKRNKITEHKAAKPTSSAPPILLADVNQNGIDFAPSADEVSRRAYFSYENQGSHQGNDVQHWLAAEAELIAERNLTRVHGFHNRT